jgi:subtilase family serine protease
MVKETPSLLLAVALSLLGLTPGFASPSSGLEARPPIHVHSASSTGPSGYTPAQIRHAYGFDLLGTTDGLGRVVAVVDAYDDSTIKSDLAAFITEFGSGVSDANFAGINGLTATSPCTVSAGPHPCFQQVFAQTPTGQSSQGWFAETSLDVEWAHAVAPGADILLVESVNANLGNLLGAVDVAAGSMPTPAAISMSWGTGENSLETSSTFDGHFVGQPTTFVAASGDRGVEQILWPAVSPYVLSVGGTSLCLDTSGNLVASCTSPSGCAETISDETVWNNAYGASGGGVSTYEAIPGYQLGYTGPVFDSMTGIAGLAGTHRGFPDVAYDADPCTGFPIYDSTGYRGSGPWLQVGGTSAGAPQWAGLIAIADQNRSSLLVSTNVNSNGWYAAGSTASTTDYRDITQPASGNCLTGFTVSWNCGAGPGYDLASGIGSPVVPSLYNSLQSY